MNQKKVCNITKVLSRENMLGCMCFRVQEITNCLHSLPSDEYKWQRDTLPPAFHHEDGNDFAIRFFPWQTAKWGLGFYVCKWALHIALPSAS